jgi:hypothetical protein
MRGQYDRLGIKTFGEHLLRSGDLDPIYLALPKVFDGDTDQLYRWLIAYWCFYHAGFASWASEKRGLDFWIALNEAAANVLPAPTGDRYPRGHERRHARGGQGIKMVHDLANRYGAQPERMVEYLVEAAPSYEGVANRAQEHTLFGPWISFKICDMLDRVLGEQVDFSEAAVFMFKDPVKAALTLWRETYNLPESAKPRDQHQVIHGVVEHLKEVFHDFKAPPLYDRPVGLQEIETILCKWKSHRNGHYPLMNDIVEIHEGLLPWARVSETAKTMYREFTKMRVTTNAA